MDQKVQYLEQNDIKLQKDLSETYDIIKELKARLAAIIGEVDQKIVNFDVFYKEAISKMQ